jgi:hypothetical protein
MTTITITITDSDDRTLSLEGAVDNPEAFNEPPTPALIVGSYLAAHAEKVSKDALKWFETTVVAPPGETQ